MLKTRHLLFFLMLLSTEFSFAAMQCRNLFYDIGQDVRIESMEDKNLPSELNLSAKTFEAKEVNAKLSAELSELILMVAQARTPIVSDKEINEKGKLILGVPIGEGFFLELKYRSNNSEESKFVLDHVNLLSPSGRQIDVSSNPIDLYDERKLSNSRTNYEIGAYPNGYKVNVKIPTLISGKVLEELKLLAPKLELLPKEEIRRLSKLSDIKELKTQANRAYMKYFIKRYTIRGVFKTLFKVLVYEPLKLLAFTGVVLTAVHTTTDMKPFTSIQQLILPTNTAQVERSLVQSISKNTPEAIKQQLEMLKTDLENKNTALADRTDAHMNLGQNFQVAKDQYLWTTTVTNKETGKAATVIFLSQDNGKGQISYAAIAVDAEKYKLLISYIKSKGQFIPISAEDLK